MQIKVTLLLVLVHVFGLAGARAQGDVERLFYYIDSSYESLTDHIDQISVIAAVGYGVDENGVVWGGVDPRVLDIARDNNVAVLPLVHNPGFDQDMLSGLLANPAARARAVESLLAECEKHAYQGIQFDFENLHMSDRDAFTTFTRETANALHAKGYELSLAVVHRPEEFAGTTDYHQWLFENWRAGYDLKALGEIADFISVMTYSQHTRRTTPGPNAGVPWVRQNVEYFLEHIPPHKLSLGIPVTSMHWSTELDEERYVANARSWAKSMSHSDAMSIAERHEAPVQWMEDQGVWFSVFDNAGLFEWIFFEDTRSFSGKLDLVHQNKLRGFSVWVLGYEDPDIWNTLRELGTE